MITSILEANRVYVIIFAILGVIFFATFAILGIAISISTSVDLDKENHISQEAVDIIVNNINCSWSDKLDGCYCIYVNSGTVGFAGSDKACNR